MSDTSRFWLCPECRKHVPARNDACQCGFDRTTVPVKMREVSAGSRPAELEESSSSRVWAYSAGAAVCGFLLYLGIVNWNRPSGGPKGLRFRLAQPSPQVVVVEGPPQASINMATGPAAGELPPPAIFAKVAPSVVVVQAVGDSGALQGSGVVVAKTTVVTNRHVVASASQISVGTTSGNFTASVVKIDPQHDLALLSVPGLSVEPVPFRTSGELQVGERVYAIGAPKGLALTLSDGLVSGLRPYEGGAAIQTSAALSPGSSGGGLFDSQGRLIGVTTFGAGGENLNFALPVEWALSLNGQSLGSASVIQTADTPKTEEQVQRDRAEAIFRPRMQQVANTVRQVRVLKRRYYDACYRRKTVTQTGGERSGTAVTTGNGQGTSTGIADISDARGRSVGSVSSVGTESTDWVSVRNWREQWSQASALENETTPECRLIFSEIADLGPKVQTVMDDADREGVRQKVWTWLLSDVPQRLAEQIWIDTLQ